MRTIAAAPAAVPQSRNTGPQAASNSDGVASPQGCAASLVTRHIPPYRTMRSVRRGCIEANSAASGHPSDTPKNDALFDPTASSTATMSATRSSSVGAR